MNKLFMVSPVLLIASMAHASENCIKEAAGAALQQVVGEYVVDARNVFDYSFKSDRPVLKNSFTLQNGDVLEKYITTIYVFTKNETQPSIVNVKVTMRDVGAALCNKENISSSHGE